MKKINPKIIGIVTLLLSALVVGGLAVQDGIGDPTVTPSDPTDDGSTP